MSGIQIYCPVCGKWLTAENPLEVLLGMDDGYIYVHDDIPHTDDDLEALDRGVQ